jgi:hypothetical protein
MATDTSAAASSGAAAAGSGPLFSIEQLKLAAQLPVPVSKIPNSDDVAAWRHLSHERMQEVVPVTCTLAVSCTMRACSCAHRVASAGKGQMPVTFNARQLLTAGTRWSEVISSGCIQLKDVFPGDKHGNKGHFKSVPTALSGRWCVLDGMTPGTGALGFVITGTICC